MISNYLIFNQTVLGNSHKRKGLPCQDYSLSYRDSDGKFLIFAVADGHGDRRCFRSAFGSKIACEVLLETLRSIVNDVDLTFLETLFNDKKKELDFFYKLKLSILNRWTENVTNHYFNNQICEDEIVKFKIEKTKGLTNDEIIKIYGTTLLGGLLIDGYLILIQQGDGHIFIFDEKGNSFDPMPIDKNCVANVTTSMSDKNALDEMRHVLTKCRENIVACFMGTDGVEDSFSSLDSTSNFYSDLIPLLINSEKNNEDLHNNLISNLDYLSLNGSEDDISVAGIVSKSIDKKLLGVYQSKKEELKCKQEINRISEKLNSMNRKLSFLENKYLEAKNKLDATSEKFDETKNQFSDLKKDYKKRNTFFSDLIRSFLLSTYDEFDHKYKELATEREKNSIVFKNAKKEYFEYKKVYDGLEKSKARLEKKYLVLTKKK